MNSLAPRYLAHALILFHLVVFPDFSTLKAAEEGTTQKESSAGRAVQVDAELTPAQARTGRSQDQRLSEAAAKRRIEYETILTSIDLTDAERAEVLGRLGELLRGAIKAGEVMEELLHARVAYDEHMRAMLGPKRFEEYRAFELSKPYRYEMEKIVAQARKRDVEIDIATQAALIPLLQEVDRHISESWDGPYDPRPRPSVGVDQVLPLLDEQINRDSKGLPRFMEKAKPKFPQEVCDAVFSHFRQSLKDLEETRRITMLSPEERRAHLDKVDEELMKRIRARPLENKKPDL